MHFPRQMTRYFQETHPASFKKGTNPGFVRLEPGQTYAIEELNEQDWDWIRINIPDVRDPIRWVPKECGVAQLIPGEPAPSEPGGKPPTGERPGRAQCNTANTYDSNVLALSWQPGFCEHAQFRGTKPECEALEAGELSISHLTIHGLWPNKRACGTRYGDCRGAALDLTEQDWGGAPGHAEGAWDALMRRTRRLDGNVIISHEILAPAPTKVIERAMKDLAGSEVHIVYSARDLARQLAAAWQESVKQGRAWTFRKFLRRSRKGKPFMMQAKAKFRDGRFNTAANEKLEILTSLTKELASFDVDGVRVLCYPGDPWHPEPQQVLPGPTRLCWRNRRFEPDGGLAMLTGE